MKTVAVHEFGHTLGFDHNWRWPSSMGNPHEEAATIDPANNTLSWSVSSQPWHDGEKLMLRIHKALPAPQGTSVSLSEGTFNVSWSAFTDAAEYRVQHHTGGT